ncbi:lasso RiPP family leader peptide-containing protein [Arthrobacter sp. NPDC057013]
MPGEGWPELPPPELVAIGDIRDLTRGSRLRSGPHGRPGQ